MKIPARRPSAARVSLPLPSHPAPPVRLRPIHFCCRAPSGKGFRQTVPVDSAVPAGSRRMRPVDKAAAAVEVDSADQEQVASSAGGPGAAARVVEVVPLAVVVAEDFFASK